MKAHGKLNRACVSMFTMFSMPWMSIDWDDGWGGTLSGPLFQPLRTTRPNYYLLIYGLEPLDYSQSLVFAICTVMGFVSTLRRTKYWTAQFFVRSRPSRPSGNGSSTPNRSSSSRVLGEV